MTAVNVASAFKQLTVQLHMRKADSEWLEHSQIEQNKTKSLKHPLVKGCSNQLWHVRMIECWADFKTIIN